MSCRQEPKDVGQMAANLRRAMELTQAGLALRLAMLRQRKQGDAGMKDVMHEIRLAKEQAWHPSRF